MPCGTSSTFWYIITSKTAIYKKLTFRMEDEFFFFNPQNFNHFPKN